MGEGEAIGRVEWLIDFSSIGREEWLIDFSSID